MLVLVKKPRLLDSILPNKEKHCAGDTTVKIINFIKQRGIFIYNLNKISFQHLNLFFFLVGTIKLDDLPKIKRLLMDLSFYAFLHLFQRDQKSAAGADKEDNQLDTYQLASCLLDFSDSLADCIENQPQLLLFVAECCGRSGIKKGIMKAIVSSIFFLNSTLFEFIILLHIFDD